MHAAAETQHEVQSRLLLDVVVRERATVLELLPGEDETLLIRGNAFLVLDFSLDVLDGVGRLDLERDGLPGESLHEDLHLQVEHTTPYVHLLVTRKSTEKVNMEMHGMPLSRLIS